ncbi:TetR family transcriptional regulator [Pseudonocardia acaciae]|uniref:TetR family transcriptional regulator n=1 Tax=Pseudonocardia acaciae TaxID=551276 RepID=UPI00048A7B98|nr:TetR/AcrR family transcriptional regulator [Pseudonocardia acaciae]
MSRPRERLGEERRREQIIRATLEVVSERGYEYASLAHIARAAGVSKGLVSHYFGTKDDLMATAARVTMTELRDAVASELDLTAPVPDVIRSALRHAAQLGRTHSTEFRALTRITHNLRGPDGLPRLTLADYEDTYRAQEMLFRRGQEEGTLRGFDTRVMAVTYQGAIDMMLAYLDEHPDIDPVHYADALADILLAGAVG